MGFLPSIPGCPLRPIKQRAARLQGWLALSPSLSSSPSGSAHLRFPWLHTAPCFSPEIDYITYYSQLSGLKWSCGLRDPIGKKRTLSVEFYFIQKHFWNKTRSEMYTTMTPIFCDIKRLLYFPESLNWRLSRNLHIMEMWFNLLQLAGLIATDSDAWKPKGCCTSSLTAELQAAHRQYFYPWKLTASALHFHSAKFWYAVFLPPVERTQSSVC